MDYLQLDLQGYRCPDVMQRVLAALRELNKSELSHLVIQTIEPSAERDVQAAISKEHADSLTLHETQVAPLSDARREEILTSPLAFDSEDLKGADNEYVILVSKL